MSLWLNSQMNLGISKSILSVSTCILSANQTPQKASDQLPTNKYPHSSVVHIFKEHRRCRNERAHYTELSRLVKEKCESFISPTGVAVEARGELYRPFLFGQGGKLLLFSSGCRLAVQAKRRIIQRQLMRSSGAAKLFHGDARELALAHLRDHGNAARELHGLVADLLAIQPDAALLYHAHRLGGARH